MKIHIVLMLCALGIIGGCAAGKKPVQTLKGEKVVCILTTGKQFKAAVVEQVSTSLAAKGYRVVTGSRTKANNYKASDYGAVVYLAEYWAMHVPFNAKRYYRRNNEAENIIFVITSGNPGVTISEPFDAVTSASTPANVARVSGEILARLERILDNK